MSNYQPEEWILVKLISEDGSIGYKVFGSWRGGYVDGDFWRMNSGITRMEQDDTHYYFHGASGSMYACNKMTYGIRSPYNNSVLAYYALDLPDNFIPLTEQPNIEELVWTTTT